MTWRPAPALVKLRDQINAAYPGRSDDWDGMLGDAAHSARKSDHNPDARGVVCAIDITHDPGRGLDSYRLADRILAAQDRRMQYVISNGRIGWGPAGYPGKVPGRWYPYTGASPHDHHVHVSVRHEPALADNTEPWAGITAGPTTPQWEDDAMLSPDAVAQIRQIIASETAKVSETQGYAGAGDGRIQRAVLDGVAELLAPLYAAARLVRYPDGKIVLRLAGQEIHMQDMPQVERFQKVLAAAGAPTDWQQL